MEKSKDFDLVEGYPRYWRDFKICISEDIGFRFYRKGKYLCLDVDLLIPSDVFVHGLEEYIVFSLYRIVFVMKLEKRWV